MASQAPTDIPPARHGATRARAAEQSEGVWMAATHAAAFAPLVEQAAKAVDDGLNVVVFGHPGAGLTSVAAELRRELGTERHVVTAAGVKAWQQASFSGLAFTSRGETTPSEGARSPAPSGPSALRSAVDEVTRAAGPTGVVLVTRPEWLDGASVGVLSQVSAREAVPIVTVVDSVTLAARRVPLLDELRPGLQLEIPLLTFDQVFQLASDRLGGPVEVATVARIRAESGGLQGVVQAMIDLGRHNGVLVHADGVWKAVREFGTVDVGAHIRHMLAGLTHGQVALLHAVAAANIDGEEFLPTSTRLDDLVVLTEAGLMRSESGRWDVFPPILEERMRHSERLLLRGQIAQAAVRGRGADARPRDRSAEVRSNGPRRNAHATGAADTVASQRLRAANRERAAQLRVAWDGTHSPADALPLVVALQASDAQSAEVEAVVNGTKPDPASADYAVLLIWWAIYRALLLGNAAGALAELSRAAADFPGFRPLFEAAVAHLRMVSGEALPDTSRLPDRPELDLGLGRVARLDSLLFTGATQDAVALASDSSGVRPVFAAQLEISGNIARMFDGSVERGLERGAAAFERAEAAGNLGLMQAHAYTVMLGLFLSGRLVEAQSFLDRTLAMSTARALHSPYQLGAIDLGVLVEALMGDEHAARRLAAVAATLTHAPMPLPGMDAFATGVALAPTGSQVALERAAAERLSKKHLLSAGFLAIAAHPAPLDRAFAEQLREQTSVSQSPLLRAIGDYAWADVAADAPRLLRLAEDFHGMGAEIFAVAARGRAAAHYFEAGQRQTALALAHDTWQASRPLGEARVGLLLPLSDRVGFTERETETILMGSQGASNKEVADALGLSQRTVENRWYAAYSKTGTSDRAELTRACLTWLRPVSSETGRPAPS